MRILYPCERGWLAIAVALATCFSLGAHAEEKPADKNRDHENRIIEKSAPDKPSAELSIAPLDHVEYPSDRPKWVQQNANDLSSPMDTDQADRVISIVVVSPPQPTAEAAAEMMEVMAKGAVENYIDQQAAMIPEPIETSKIVVEMDWIRNELITRRYDGEVRSGDQSEYESACWLQLTAEHQAVLQNLIQNHRLMHRLGAVGVFALGGFATLVGGSILFSGLAARQQRRAS